MNRFLIILLFLPFFAVGQTADSTISRKLDEYFESANRAYRFTGSALVVRDGKVLLHKAYGWRNWEQQQHNDTSTSFPILSITKSFTAALILLLEEQGKLALSDKLSKFLPEISNSNKVTIRQLLNHSSGLPNYTDPIGIEDSNIVCNPVPRERIIELFNHKPLEMKPGRYFSYNNTGYYLLGMVIEKLTGKSYEQVIRERIFQPLKMYNSGFDFNGLAPNLRATGYYRFRKDEKLPICYLDSTVGYSAGGIYSTTGDMNRWMEALSNQQILSKSSWNKALDPQQGDYGYGWWIRNLYGRKYFTHTGGYPGYMSMVSYFPSEKISIILLNNYGTYGQNIMSIMMAAAAISLGLPYDNWQEREERKLDSLYLQRLTGTYTLDKSRYMTLTVADGRLLVTGNRAMGYLQLPLLAETGDQFFFEDYNTVFRFVMDESGKPTKLIIHEHGGDTEWKKTK